MQIVYTKEDFWVLENVPILVSAWRFGNNCMALIQYPLLFTVHVQIVYLFQLSLAPLQTFKQTFFTAWYVLGPFNSCLAWLQCCWKLGLYNRLWWRIQSICQGMKQKKGHCAYVISYFHLFLSSLALV